MGGGRRSAPVTTVRMSRTAGVAAIVSVDGAKPLGNDFADQLSAHSILGRLADEYPDGC